MGNALDNIIGVEDAAKILNLSPGTVKNKCAANELPAKKIGKTWLLDKTKLMEVIEMKELNVTKFNGQLYKLPTGYYAIDGRFGDKVYDPNGKNVSQKIMGANNPDDIIILTDSGVVKLDKV